MCRYSHFYHPNQNQHIWLQYNKVASVDGRVSLPGLESGSVTYKLRNFGQVTCPFLPVSASVKWEQ